MRSKFEFWLSFGTQMKESTTIREFPRNVKLSRPFSPLLFLLTWFALGRFVLRRFLFGRFLLSRFPLESFLLRWFLLGPLLLAYLLRRTAIRIKSFILSVFPKEWMGLERLGKF
jgi:hypothetical protein